MGSAPSTTFLSSFGGNSLVMDKQSMMVRHLLLGEDKDGGEKSSRHRNYAITSHHSSSGSSVGHVSSYEASPTELHEHHIAPPKSISPERRSSVNSISSTISSLSESTDSSKGRVKSIHSNHLIHSYEFWSQESINFEECRQETEMQNIQMEIKKKKSPKHSDMHGAEAHHHHHHHHKKTKNNGWVQEPSPKHHTSTSKATTNSHHLSSSTASPHSTHHSKSPRSKSIIQTDFQSSVPLSSITTRHSIDSTIHKSPIHLPHKLGSIQESPKHSQQTSPNNSYNLPLIPFHLNLSASWDRQKAIELYEKSLKQHHDSKSAQEFGS